VQLATSVLSKAAKMKCKKCEWETQSRKALSRLRKV
jgi:hypothetical protein